MPRGLLLWFYGVALRYSSLTPIIRQALYSECHCEPARTLVWQSVPPKAPLADQGWCSAQRIKIEMIASGNHTIICAAPVRTLGLRGSELSSFRALSIKRGFTIPQSAALTAPFTQGSRWVLPHQRADEGIGPYKILIGLQ